MSAREATILRQAPIEVTARGGLQSRMLKMVLAVVLYLVLICLPLILLFIGPTPKGTGFWWDFSMGLGFAALAMLGLQFVLTARFGRLAAPFGTDIIYFFHRWAATGAVVLILAHYGILRIAYGEALGSAAPQDSPWYMAAGRAALLVFILLIVSSWFRKQLRIEYDWWRLTHGVLAMAGMALALGHILGVGYYSSVPSQRILWIGYTALWVLILIYIRLIQPWLLLRKPYQLTEIQQERGNSWTVTLEPTGSHSLKFAPGQFAWLTLGTSPFRGKEHPFSIASSAEDPRKLKFTIKELGDFTRTIRNFRPGAKAYVDGPHGVFTTDHYPEAPGFGFIAGGVGIAPIMSILRTLADRGEKRPMILIYGNSTWDRVLFREELEQLQTRLNLRVVHVLHSPPAEWNGESGLVTADLLRRNLGPEAAALTYFVCGPVAMTHVVQDALSRMEVPLRRIHSEHFEMA